MKYFDTHAHINSEYFDQDIEKSITDAKHHGVDKIVLPGTTPQDSLSNILFAEKHDGIFAMVGVHPTDSYLYEEGYLDKVEVDKIVAVGEIGLDFYRSENPPQEVQVKNFMIHLDFALKHNKPVVIHMRDSEEEIYKILSKYAEKGLNFLMHSYTSSLNWAEKFLELGAYFSFSGIVTFKNAQELKEVAKMIPKNRIVVETDSPFLAPEPVRRKKNEPQNVRFIANYIAALRDDDSMIEALYKNAIEFFCL